MPSPFRRTARPCSLKLSETRTRCMLTPASVLETEEPPSGRRTITPRGVRSSLAVPVARGRLGPAWVRLLRHDVAARSLPREGPAVDQDQVRARVRRDVHRRGILARTAAAGGREALGHTLLPTRAAR